MRKSVSFACLLLICSVVARADDGTKLFYALRSKILTVKDYTADVKVKIDVSFMRVPQLRGTLYFKAPDKMRLERNGGLSMLPKKNINLTISNLIPSGNVTVIDMGQVTVKGKKLRLLKAIPEDETSNIILTKIWVDETSLVATRAETTTRNDGTVIMDLDFGRYIPYGLPDKVVIYMNVKDYKLPKGVTMDYNDETEATKAPKNATQGPQKGTIEINYLKYDINTGLSDAKFGKK